MRVDYALGQARLAESLAFRLQESFGEKICLVDIRHVAGGRSLHPASAQLVVKTTATKPIPTPQAEAQIRDRREMLSQKMASIQVRKASTAN